MIEEAIKNHITEKLAEAFPEMDADQVMVAVPAGQMIYGGQKGRSVIGEELLTARITIRSEADIDRLPVLRAFKRQTVKTPEGDLWQEYQRHERHEYVEAIGGQGVVFYIEYKRTITEE